MTIQPDSCDNRTRLTALAGATQNWQGGLAAPRGLGLDPGETTYFILGGVQLIELTKTPLPIIGGTSGFSFGASAAMAAPHAVLRRSIWVDEVVSALDTGTLVITDRRVILSGSTTRAWTFGQMQGLSHDEGVPETWLAPSQAGLLGLRYAASDAVDLRFCLSLALATQRGERSALAASIARELAQMPARSKARIVGQVVRRLYLGSPGARLPWRVAQGFGAAVLTLVLLGAVLPNPQHNSSSGSPSRAAGFSSASESDASQRDHQAGDAAAAPKADTGRAGADKAVADAAAAQQAAVDQAAAEASAVQKAAAAKAVADKAAADKAAAERAAAAAAARKAAAEKAAAQKATDQRAAAAAAQAAAAPSGGGNCTPAYPDFCIPQRAGDAYNCSDFSEKNFTALPEDPYRLDRDGDGTACES